MPHMPGHGISFADWFRNNPIQISQSGGQAVVPNYSGMRMGGSSEAGMMNPDLWNMNIPNPTLNFGQIGSDIQSGLGYLGGLYGNLGSRYFDQNRPITVSTGDGQFNIPSPSIQGGQVRDDLLSTGLFDSSFPRGTFPLTHYPSGYPTGTVGTGGNPALQWLQTGQPFAPSETSMVVPPPRAHDAPPQDSNRMADFLTAFNTAMGQSAGYTPPTGGLSVSVGGQQIVGGNRLDQEGLADSMNRVRAATMVPPPNPSDLGVPPSVRDPMQWLQAGQPYAPPATPMVVPQPSPVDMGMPISAPIQSPAGRGSLPIEVLIASGGGLKRGLGNQMSSQLPPAYLSQMMQRRGMN